jgi:hypothetical protein
LVKRKPKLERKKAMRNSLPKRKKRQALNIKGVFTDIHEESDENTPYGFCGLKYCSVQSVQKDDWICSQKCEKCYYEVCAGVT